MSRLCQEVLCRLRAESGLRARPSLKELIEKGREEDNEATLALLDLKKYYNIPTIKI